MKMIVDPFFFWGGGGAPVAPPLNPPLLNMPEMLVTHHVFHEPIVILYTFVHYLFIHLFIYLLILHLLELRLFLGIMHFITMSQ